MTRPATIVTGSSRGIGAAIATEFARRGHRLTLVARSGEQLDATAAGLRALGAEAITVAVDLRQAAAVETVMERATAAFGPPDIIVSNAGTAPADKVERTTTAVLQATFDLHVAAPLAFARAAVAGFKERGRGCLMHLASTAGLRGYPFTSAYTAAKHGMVGLTRALHAELAPAGIDVYAVCPGFVDTEITRNAAAAVAARGKLSADEAFDRMAAQNEIGRMHLPAEVATAVAQLVEERPRGCVYALDRDEPGFVDEPPIADGRAT